eukprot:gb/GECG01002952.1/.p1 GENE.gb/GECG01002952.1/~~gb/GECG01002952.1/.p1  ORF type:complete len:375 (+),score=50.14 gb/GECG01002952.1/:1-1125(+)
MSQNQGDSRARHRTTDSGKMAISKEEWSELLSRVPLSKSFLNNVVMEYLVIEGHRDAAAALERESGCQPQQSLQSIEDRVEVRNAIMAKDIGSALEKLHEINPRLLEEHPELHFRLLQQQTCDLIGDQNWPKALEVAQSHLAKLAADHVSMFCSGVPPFVHTYESYAEQANLLEDLEKTMSLFAFVNPGSSPFGSLLSVEFRLETAHQANKTLLEDARQSTSSRIPDIIRTLLFSQETLHKQHNTDFPKIKETKIAFGGLREGSWDVADSRTQMEMDAGVYRSIDPVLEADYDSPKDRATEGATATTQDDLRHDNNGDARASSASSASSAQSGLPSQEHVEPNGSAKETRESGQDKASNGYDKQYDGRNKPSSS